MKTLNIFKIIALTAVSCCFLQQSLMLKAMILPRENKLPHLDNLTNKIKNLPVNNKQAKDFKKLKRGFVNSLDEITGKTKEYRFGLNVANKAIGSFCDKDFRLDWLGVYICQVNAPMIYDIYERYSQNKQEWENFRNLIEANDKKIETSLATITNIKSSIRRIPSIDALSEEVTELQKKAPNGLLDEYLKTEKCYVQLPKDLIYLAQAYLSSKLNYNGLSDIAKKCGIAAKRTLESCIAGARKEVKKSAIDYVQAKARELKLEKEEKDELLCGINQVYEENGYKAVSTFFSFYTVLNYMQQKKVPLLVDIKYCGYDDMYCLQIPYAVVNGKYTPIDTIKNGSPCIVLEGITYPGGNFADYEKKYGDSERARIEVLPDDKDAIQTFLKKFRKQDIIRSIVLANAAADTPQFVARSKVYDKNVSKKTINFEGMPIMKQKFDQCIKDAEIDGMTKENMNLFYLMHIYFDTFKKAKQ